MLEAPREGRKHRRSKWTRIPCFRQCCPEAEPVHFALKEVVGAAQVTVGVEGRANVGVAEDLLDGCRAGAKAEHERRGRVPEIVEPKLKNLAVSPQLHPAARAPALATVLRGFRVTAALAPALVDVTLHDARAPEGGAQDAGEVGVLGPAAAVGARKDQIGRRGGDGDLEVGDEFGGDRDRLFVAPLGGIVAVGPPHMDRAMGEIDVHLPESEEFALALAGVDGGGEQGTPRQGDRCQNRSDLVGLEESGFSLRGLLLGHPLAVDRIGAMEAIDLLGRRDPADEQSQVVDCARADDVLLIIEEGENLPRSDLRRRQVCELAVEQSSDGADASRMRTRLRQMRIDPPLDKIAKGRVGVLEWGHVESQPDPILFQLELDADALDLGFGPGDGWHVMPLARVHPDAVVPFAAEEKWISHV